MLVANPAQVRADDTPVYLNKSAALEDRVNDLVGKMTLDEKISLLAGDSWSTLPAIPRLHVPLLRMVNAGAGVGGMDKFTDGPATSFACGVLMGATWDTDLIKRVAAAIGEETRSKGGGSQILLGPDFNIQRSPLGGRNAEAVTEDPWLGSRLAVAYIQGMQGTGIAASIKHFVCNNEEIDRKTVNVQVDERALREIYLPTFEASVREGHVWTVMSSYNCVNGAHSSANRYLLTDVLDKGWGFDGMVMSDWDGVHAVAPTINAGNNVEMPGPPVFLTPENVKAALAKGETTQAAIDESVRRTVRTMIRTGLLDGPWHANPAEVNSPAHQKLARELAEQGIVLLKNDDGVLPLNASKIHSIAIIGPAARAMQTGALGSPGVKPPYAVGPLEGIRKRAGGGVEIHYVAEGPETLPQTLPGSVMKSGDSTIPQGFSAEYFDNPDLHGEPLRTRIDPEIDFMWKHPPKRDVICPFTLGLPGIGPDNFSVRWMGTLIAPETGRYEFRFDANSARRLYIDGKKVIDYWQPDAALQIAQVDLVAGHSYSVRAEYSFTHDRACYAMLQWLLPRENHCAEEVAAARHSDIAIVCLTTFKNEGEEHDRVSMSLPNEQDLLVQRVAAANKRTIVVLNNGTPIDMQPWIRQVPGVIEAWFPGQEGGNALAGILFGDVNPSGKLPTTMGFRREDYPDYGHFPGVDGVVQYREGIYVGYRHFDKENIAPLYPFGYGLSYTTFDYGPVQLSSPKLAPDGNITVSLPIKNTGTREGREVVELYIHDPAPKIDKPVRELKGFAKIDLAPGETKTVTIPVTPRDLAYFDVPGKQWKADAGDYEIQVGASSRDLRQKATVRLSRDFTEAVPLSADQLTLNGGFNSQAVKTP